MSFVSAIPAAAPEVAAAHFAARLSLETDCADVAAAMRAGEVDFVLLHLRHAEISAERMSAWPADTLFVVYCAGPHCNGADQAALKLARLGRPVKLMIGGITGWADEGLPFAEGAEPGSL